MISERREKRSFERRLIGWMVLIAAPPLLVALLLLLRTPTNTSFRILIALLLLVWVISGLRVLHQRAVRPLRTVANLLGALREGDFSLRLRGYDPGDALGELVDEANALAALFRRQRLEVEEASGLLSAVLAEIDVAILVFDGEARVVLANRAAERLLGRTDLVGAAAIDLELDDGLAGEASRTLDRQFPGASGRFVLRRALVRAGGAPHQLLAIANLSNALREEERSAWQRLIRVLGHELNNTLAPIKSISGTLARRLGQIEDLAELAPETRADLVQGLSLIAERSGALARFLEGYSRLARLPAPRRRVVEIGELVRKVAASETRFAIEVLAGPRLELELDSDQIGQLLVNLLGNAVDASLERPGALPVQVSWRRDGTDLLLEIQDDGPGLANPSNLFVPFFTTKRGGSGIGLVLCRQIAEAHGGQLSLRSGPAGGCVAELRLPVGIAPALSPMARE